MEGVQIAVDADLFNQAIHGGLDALPILRDNGDLSIFIKPRATVSGKPAVVLTFTVQLPDGSFARVQTVTTAAIIENAGAACKGWREGGYI